MINYIKQDITDVTRGIVAHGCNCQGVMGSGVARAIRRAWPSTYEAYAHLCKTYDQSKDLLGIAHFVTVEKNLDNLAKIMVANLFTQHQYGNDGRKYANLEAIATALDETFRMACISNLPIYMPRIGCGLGGLKWDIEVGPVVERLANDYPTVELNVCDL